MELAILIGTDGKSKAIYSMTNNAHVILTSQKALEFIMEQVESNNLACKECARIVRSDELQDGVCQEGLGHRLDPDFDELAKLSEPFSSARAADMAHNLLHSGIVSLHMQYVGPLGWNPDPPRPEAPGGEY